MKGHLFSHMARTNSTSLDSLIAYILLPPCSAPRRIDEVAKASTRATHPCVNSNNSKPGPPDELPQICCSPKVPGSKRPPCQGGKHQEKQTKALRETHKNKKTRESERPVITGAVLLWFFLSLLPSAKSVHWDGESSFSASGPIRFFPDSANMRDRGGWHRVL